MKINVRVNLTLNRNQIDRKWTKELKRKDFDYEHPTPDHASSQDAKSNNMLTQTT